MLDTILGIGHAATEVKKWPTLEPKFNWVDISV